MATETKKTAEVKEERKYPKSNIALWKKTSENGKKYLANNDGLIGYYNTNKKNPKEPDLRVFVKLGSENLELASLWCNVSEKTGNKYLSGKLIDGTKLIGFFNKVEEGSKKPNVLIYLNESEGSEVVEPKPTTTEGTKIQDDDLPF